MSNETTKGCNLTEKEVMQLMAWYGYNLGEDTEDKMERLKYLNSRLKAFRETGEDAPKAETPKAAEPMPAAPTGWGASA